MSHGHAAGPGAEECRISMLWNWTTVGACFLTPKWFIRTEGMMVASCVGVMLLTAAMELLKRGGRELDKMLADRITWSVLSTTSPTGQRRIVTARASAWQQLLRSVLHAITFVGAYIVMLLAMYFNGYILISIFIGSALGKFFTDWFMVSTVLGAAGQDKVDNKEGGRGDETQETAICCSKDI